MAPRFRRLSLALTLLGLVVLLVERSLVSDEERVEAALLVVLAAAEDESSARLDALFADQLRYVGPAPVGRGDRAEALRRFGELWEASEALSVQHRAVELTTVGSLATLRTSLLVRFTVGGSLVLYRADTVLTFDRVGEDYLLSEVEFTDLRPGIL